MILLIMKLHSRFNQAIHFHHVKFQKLITAIIKITVILFHQALSSLNQYINDSNNQCCPIISMHFHIVLKFSVFKMFLLFCHQMLSRWLKQRWSFGYSDLFTIKANTSTPSTPIIAYFYFLVDKGFLVSVPNSQTLILTLSGISYFLILTNSSFF